MINGNKKNIITLFIATIGTLLEWAEYTFYGYLAFKLSALFFPEGNQTANLLKTYGIFAIGYIMRPFGAIVFGHIGDSFGRKIALMMAIFLMGIATLGIGCLPTYEHIGILAPIGLLALRMLQGLAISGEYNGAGIFIIEQMGKNRPCFAGSWISASAAGGMVLGGLAAYLVSLPGAPEWAWRVPFMLGGLSCLLSGYVRQHIPESPEFLEAKAQNKSLNAQSKNIPILTVIKDHRSALLTVGMIAAFIGVFVYIGNIYMVVFLKEVVGLPAHHATFFAMAGEACAALLIPVMGHMADKHHNAEGQFKIGLLVAIFSAPLIFWLAYTGDYWSISLSMVLFGLANAIASGPTVKLLNDQFPAELRYTGISVAWSVSAAIFGGTAPMVAHYLAGTLDWWLGPSFYICAIAIMTWLFLSHSTIMSPFHKRVRKFFQGKIEIVN